MIAQTLESRDVQSTRLVTNDDHGAIITVSAAFGMTCMLLVLLTRLLIRWPWKALFRSDDIAAVVGSILAVVQVIVVEIAVSHGLGRRAADNSQSSLITIEKLLYSSDLLFVLATFLGKLTIALLFFRLAAAATSSQIASGLAIVCGVFTLAAFLTVAVPEPGSLPWNYQTGAGSNMVAHWIAVATMSNILEIALAIFPVILVWDLRMPRVRKTLIAIGMWSRLPLIPVSILRILYLSRSLHDPSFTFAYAATETLTQVEMSWSLISATIPCLRVFLKNFNTGLLAANEGALAFDTAYCAGTSHISDPTCRTEGLHYGQSAMDAKSNGSGMGTRISVKSRGSKKSVSESFDVGSFSAGQHSAKAESGDAVSMTSDCSQMAIVVKQTYNVQYST